MMLKVPTFVATVLFIHCLIKSGLCHDEFTGPEAAYLTWYEGLSYSPEGLHYRHQRVKRSLGSGREDVLKLDFSALNRKFKLRLRRDTSTFVEHPELIDNDGTISSLDTSHIYQGHLEGEPGSYVHGSVIAGIFSGRIDLSDGRTFYVDKSEQHFPGTQSFHSIVYEEGDVLDELPAHKKNLHVHQQLKKKRSASSSVEDQVYSCGLTDSDVHQWMKNVQNSAVEPTVKQKRSVYNGGYNEVQNHDFYLRYAKDHQLDHSNNSYRWENGNSRSGRTRRDTASEKNRLCALFLQSDPMLWDYMTRSASQSGTGEKPGLGYDPSRAREEITSLFASHVDGIKKIYMNTVFQYDSPQGPLGPFRSFTFAVHRVQINTTADCNDADGGEDKFPFCKKNIDVSNFLNLNSLTNHDLYCLAYVFTYRDFTQGTLGLAWVGSALRASGGLCERWKEYSENNKRVFKSLNTGIVTLVNYGNRVPPKVSTLTFAHEVGHNFGSPHDSGEECVPTLLHPNDANGNYIMFASATSGDKPNNHKFSPCSIGNMTQVLSAVLKEEYGKFNCFRESEEAFCGNRIKEDNEECDCGFESDCNDPEHPDICCYPQEDQANACKRKPGKKCSASEGPCCVGSSCSFVTLSSNKTCQVEKDCSEASVCNGTSARCPLAKPKQDLSLCNSNTQICSKGECTGSVCEKIGWSLCFMDAPANDKTYDRGLLCFVSCLNPDSKKCISTGSKDDLKSPENSNLTGLLDGLGLRNDGIRMPAGMPCDNYRGYCDVFQKCRAVNEDGPLARLKNLLFSEKTFGEIRDWITTYWYLVIPMALGVIILMALFIKVCAVHTPSSNPKQTPARKLTLPRRHAHRPQGPPPPYSETGGLTPMEGGSGSRGAPQPRQNRSRQPQAARRQPSPANSSRGNNKRKQPQRSSIEMKYRSGNPV